MPEKNPITDKFTGAQLEYLMLTVENAALSGGWNFDPNDEKRPGLQRGSVYSIREDNCVKCPEQTIRSITRRGGAEEFEKSNPWPHRYWRLTSDGILAGLAEYRRVRGKDLPTVAKQRKAEIKRVVDRDTRIVKAIAKPFRGINIRIGEGGKRKTRDLGVHIEKTIMGKGTATTVDFDRSMLEQLGKSIDALRKK